MADLAIVSIEIESSGAQRGARQTVSALKALQREFAETRRAARSAQAAASGAAAGTNQFGGAAGQSRQQSVGLLQGLRELTNAFRGIVGVTLAVDTGLRVVTGAWNLYAAAMGAVVDVLGQFVSISFEVTRALDTARTGIAGLISAAFTISNSDGIQLQGIDKTIASLAVAKDQMRQLEIAAFRTAASPLELAEAFEQVVASGARAKGTLAEIRGLTVDIAVAAKAVGIRKGGLAQEVRALVEGTVDRNARVAVGLGITDNAELRKLKEAGKLFEFLATKFQDFRTLGKVLEKTFGGVIDQLTEVGTSLAGVVLSPLWEQLRVNAVRISEAILKPDTGAEATSLASVLTDGANKALEMIRGVVLIIGRVLGVAFEIVTYKAIQFFRVFSEGGGMTELRVALKQLGIEVIQLLASFDPEVVAEFFIGMIRLTSITVDLFGTLSLAVQGLVATFPALIPILQVVADVIKQIAAPTIALYAVSKLLGFGSDTGPKGGFLPKPSLLPGQNENESLEQFLDRMLKRVGDVLSKAGAGGGKKGKGDAAAARAAKEAAREAEQILRIQLAAYEELAKGEQRIFDDISEGFVKSLEDGYEIGLNDTKEFLQQRSKLIYEQFLFDRRIIQDQIANQLRVAGKAGAGQSAEALVADPQAGLAKIKDLIGKAGTEDEARLLKELIEPLQRIVALSYELQKVERAGISPASRQRAADAHDLSRSQVELLETERTITDEILAQIRAKGTLTEALRAEVAYIRQRADIERALGAGTIKQAEAAERLLSLEEANAKLQINALRREAERSRLAGDLGDAEYKLAQAYALEREIFRVDNYTAFFSGLNDELDTLQDRFRSLGEDLRDAIQGAFEDLFSFRNGNPIVNFFRRIGDVFAARVAEAISTILIDKVVGIIKSQRKAGTVFGRAIDAIFVVLEKILDPLGTRRKAGGGTGGTPTPGPIPGGPPVPQIPKPGEVETQTERQTTELLLLLKTFRTEVNGALQEIIELLRQILAALREQIDLMKNTTIKEPGFLKTVLVGAGIGALGGLGGQLGGLGGGGGENDHLASAGIGGGLRPSGVSTSSRFATYAPQISMTVVTQNAQSFQAQRTQDQIVAQLGTVLQGTSDLVGG